MKPGFVSRETTVKVEAGGRSAVAPKLVEAAGGQNGPVYAEIGVQDLQALHLTVAGLDPCSDAIGPNLLCGAAAVGIRLGYRVNGSLSAEATAGVSTFRWWHDDVARDKKITLDQTRYGIAGVWNPAASRYLGIAAELGIVQGSFSDGVNYIFGVSARTLQFTSPYAELQGRLDYTWGRFQAGLRLGLLGTRIPKTFTSQLAPPTLSVERGLVLILDVGFGLRVWF